MSPILIAALVGGVVYVMTRTANAGPPNTSVPVPPDSPPQDDVGGGTHDMTPLPDGTVGTQRPWSEIDRGKEGRIVTMPYYPSEPGPILTAPPPRPPSGQKPFPHGGTVKPQPRDHRAPPPKTPSKTGVVCVRAPCPVVPTSGQPDPHAVGVYAGGRLSKEPITF